MSQNPVSKYFCVLPWTQLHVDPDSVVKPCCVYDYDDHFGDVSKQSFDEIWNGPKFKLLRKEMLNGTAPAGCKHCHKNEEAGFISLRNSVNSRLKSEIKKILFLADSEGHAEPVLKALDIRFSNICNFKCRGCSPKLSSTWFDDYVALKRIGPDELKVRSIKAESPEFWKIFQDMINDLEYIYFGGGEPLITKEHFDLLRLLIQRNRNDKVDISYNTNLSTLKYDGNSLPDLWQQFRSVEVGVSLDDIGPRAEYFRHGTKWEVIDKNLKALRDNHKNVYTYINCTISLLNVYYLPELYDYIIEEKVSSTQRIVINLMQSPSELCIDVLPLNAKTVIAQKLEAYIENLEARSITRYSKDLKNIISEMMRTDNSHLFPEFIESTKKLDELRGEDFKTTYPELQKIFFT